MLDCAESYGWRNRAGVKFCSLETGDAVWLVVTFRRVWMDLGEQYSGHRLHFEWVAKWL